MFRVILLFGLTVIIDLCFGQFKTYSKVKFELLENTLVGSLIGRINSSEYGTNVKMTGIMRGNIAKYIYFDSSTGWIKIQHVIDREQICSEQDELCILKFKIKIEVDGIISMIDVDIKILDENDCSPSFPNKNYRLSINEASKIGSKIQLPRATDRDSWKNGIKYYSIEYKSGGRADKYFRLINQKNPENNEQILPYLEQISMLDREYIDLFQLKLVANDYGSRKDDTNIEILVEDYNDNYPEWFGLPYKVFYKECDNLNKPLITLLAKDKDLGSYGSVSYKINSLADNFLKSHFHLYNNNLFVSSSLDYEIVKHRHLKIPVLAVDDGGLTNSTDVELNLEDCNDNSPIIKLIFQNKNDNTPNQMKIQNGDYFQNYFNQYQHGGNYKIYIDENYSDEFNLLPIDVSDADSFENGKISCELTSYTREFRLFLLNDDKENGLIFLLIKNDGVSFDREKLNNVRVDLTCRDYGQHSKSSKKSILITIRDLNDNKPKLVNSNEFFVKENNPRGTLIGELEGLDDDEGVNKVIEYFLVNQTEENAFHLTKSGKIFVDKILDREIKVKYGLFVKLCDKGIPQLCSEYSVRVNVVDVNDEDPEYLGSRTFTIDESFDQTVIQKVLGKLNATDKDIGENAMVDFTLEKFNIIPKFCQNMYSITKSNLLIVRGVLDREQSPIHQLIVVLTDRGEPKRSSTVQLTVHLLDLNDEKPEFIFPNSKDNSVNISLDLTPGTLITMLKAKDADSGNNSVIKFSINPPSSYFKVTENGEVILEKVLSNPINSYFIPRHNLNVRAQDLGNKSLYRNTILVINVKNLNSNEFYYSKQSNNRQNNQNPENSNVRTNPNHLNNNNNNKFPGYPRDDFYTEEEESTQHNKRRQMNLLVLIVMAILVIAVFFSVVAVLTFIYYKKERLAIFATSRNRRNHDKSQLHISHSKLTITPSTNPHLHQNLHSEMIETKPDHQNQTMETISNNLRGTQASLVSSHPINFHEHISMSPTDNIRVINPNYYNTLCVNPPSSSYLDQGEDSQKLLLHKDNTSPPAIAPYISLYNQLSHTAHLRDKLQQELTNVSSPSCSSVFTNNLHTESHGYSSNNNPSRSHNVVDSSFV